MRASIALRAFAGVVAGGLLVGGCLPEMLIDAGNPLGAFIVFLTYKRPKSSPAAEPPKPVKGSLEVPLTGSIGGLSGEYSIGFDKYGSFAGTAKIGKDLRSATLKVKDTPALIQMVGGMIADAVGEDVSVTTATAKCTGRQTTGGVKKSWNGTITFQGTILTGANQGLIVKGSIKSKGHL